MNGIRNSFTISDLENFSGIKAHTLRAWERRYGLFSPDRTEGNQRCYDIESLQKLLSVKQLYNQGHKISRIAACSAEEIAVMLNSSVEFEGPVAHWIDRLTMSMLQYDRPSFETIYTELIAAMTFRDVFLKVFVPFLEQIGLLWQTDTITPAHEHFVSNLIQQKILFNIEQVKETPHADSVEMHVLYLPHDEIHDLGLLYLHFELLMSGKRSIYLGQSVPIDSLVDVRSRFSRINFVSYFTVEPPAAMLSAYLSEFDEKLVKGTKNQMWILGRRTADINPAELSKTYHVYPGLRQLVESKTWTTS